MTKVQTVNSPCIGPDALHGAGLEKRRRFLVGVGHCTGAGKSTFARLLAHELNVIGLPAYVEHISQPIKDIASRYFSVREAGYYEKNRVEKDRTVMAHGMTPREIYVELGTAFRRIDPDVLIRAAIGAIRDNVIAIFDDLRFPNELRKMDYSIRVNRDQTDYWAFEQGIHGVMSCARFSADVDNNGSPGDLAKLAIIQAEIIYGAWSGKGKGTCA